MTIQNKNVPALRFPEFNGNWEDKKLSDISNIYDGTHQTPKYVSEGVKFVSVEDIEDIENTSKFISKEAFEKDFKVKPQTDDILMTRITAGIIGATAIVTNDKPLGYYVSLALIRSKKDTDVRFLNERINSQQFKHELHKRIIHVAFPKKINLGEIGECKAAIPKFSEQQKIADFLTAVNNKIHQLTKKKDILEQYKKGLKQKIFNQEIRFKDDNGNNFADWEEINLGKLVEVTTGNKDTQNRIEDGKYPFFVRSQTIERINSYSFNGEAILTSGDGVGVGKNFHYINGKFDYHQRVYCLSNFRAHVHGKYFFFFFSEHFNKRVMRMSAKNSVDSVRRDMITEMPISLPCFEEQQKIADFLTAIDEKLNLVNQELEKTQTFKKGLLQQMFV